MKITKRFFNNESRRNEVIALVDANINRFAEEIAEELKDWQAVYNWQSLEGECKSRLFDKVMSLMSKHFAEKLGGEPNDYDFYQYRVEIMGFYRDDMADLYEDNFKFDFARKYGQMVLDVVNAKRAETEETVDELIEATDVTDEDIEQMYEEYTRTQEQREAEKKMRNKVSKIFFNNPKRREEVIKLVEDNLKFIIADMAVELKDWQPEFHGDTLEGTCHGLLLDKIIELMQTYFAEKLGGKPEDYRFGRFAQEIAGDYDPDDTTLCDTFKFDFVLTHLHEVIPPVRAYRAMGVA